MPRFRLKTYSLVRDGVIHTPDIAGGALDGITRQTIITIAKDLAF